MYLYYDIHVNWVDDKTHRRRMWDSTLLFGAVPLLHGNQGREVSLVVRQHQGRAMAAGSRHLQWQVDASKRDWSKGCRDIART